jgi:superfamily II DNA or RNA helicase
VSLPPHAPSPADLAVRLRDRRQHAPLPARPPGNQAKPAADITDWTALTPDDFFAALKTACRAESVPAAAVPETERRLADGALQARELHQVLLTSGQNDQWASVRQAALVALTERPDMAVTVVHLESQRLGSPAAFEETADGAGFTARAALTVDGQPVTGQPGRGASKKTARQLAALSLIATLAGLPDPFGQTQDPDTGDTRSCAIGSEELLAAIHDGTPPAPQLAEGLAARRLSAQELHDLLLAADPVTRAAARKVAWEQLTRSPQLAGGVLSLYTQSRGQASVRYVTIAGGVVVAVLPHHDWIQEGTHVGAPGRAATTKAAQAAAALALLADLMPPLADEDQVTAPGRNPLIELNERAQVGAITDLGFTVTAVGPPHDPVFTCSAACRHADGEISGTGQGRTKSQARAAAAEALLAELAGPAEPAPPSHTQAVSRYATSPAGVADRLLQAGCAIGYARGQFHLGLPDGWPLPEELPDLPVPAAHLLPVLARVRSQDAHPSVRAWAHLATAVLAAVARRDVYPAVDASGCDRWALVLPDGALPGQAGEAGAVDEADAREFTDLVAEHLLRTPGAALIAGSAPYVGRPAQLPGDIAEWADRCAGLADRRPGRPLVIRLRIQDEGTTGELLPRDLGYPELRMVRRARRIWPPLNDLSGGPVRLPGSAVAPLAGAAGRELSSLGVRIEWPENVARGLVARAVLVPRAAGAVSARSTVAVRWGLWLDDAALTEQESAAVARAEGLIRMRGQWVVIDPASRDRARDPGLPAITGSQAISAALTGQIQVGADTLDCEATGRLAGLVASSRRLHSGEPRPDEPHSGEPRPDEPVTISGLKASLRHYQRRAVAWLAGITGLGFGAVLADDMGLGKTLTIIAFHLHRSAGPTIVVCPASLLTNWEREIARFAPGVPVRRHHGAARDLNGLPAGGIVLTSYGTLLRDVDQFRGISFALAVADEAQNIKNPRSMQAAAIRHLDAELRVAVTGTPVENSLTDLWSILDWTNPGLFGTAKAFRATANGESLNRLVGPFVLRRRKTDPAIAAELPDKIVSDHLVELTPEQTALYTAVARDTFRSIRASSGIQRRGLILRMLQALRQICNSPAHYLRERPDGWDSDSEAARSGKLAALDGLLTAIAERGEASLIFTSYVSMAHLLAVHLSARGIHADVVRGGIQAARRQEMVDRFQSGAGECLILSVRAAGVGLNLTRADHVIHFDRHWNPAVEDQATDRAHRIGRRETVHVHHLIAENTVEDHIGELLRHKRATADRLLTGDEMSLTELTDEELGQIVSLGAAGRRDQP